VWISRVRRKLGAKPGEPGRIRTFQGIGYLLDVEGNAGGGPEDAADDAPELDDDAVESDGKETASVG
jgi:DNA-binding winged helix-turn-helix (wHTH) protein